MLRLEGQRAASSSSRGQEEEYGRRKGDSKLGGEILHSRPVEEASRRKKRLQNKSETAEDNYGPPVP